MDRRHDIERAALKIIDTLPNATLLNYMIKIGEWCDANPIASTCQCGRCNLLQNRILELENEIEELSEGNYES